MNNNAKKQNEELEKEVSFNEIRYNKHFKQYINDELGTLSQIKDEVADRNEKIKERIGNSKAFNLKYYNIVENPNKTIKVVHKKDYNEVPITELHQHKGKYSFKNNIHTFVEEKENGEKEKTDFIITSVMQNPFNNNYSNLPLISLSLIYNNNYTREHPHSQFYTYGFENFLFGTVYDIPKNMFMAFKNNAESNNNINGTYYNMPLEELIEKNINFLVRAHPDKNISSLFNKNYRGKNYDKNKNLEYLLEFLCKLVRSNEKKIDKYLKDNSYYEDKEIINKNNEMIVYNEDKEKEKGYCFVLHKKFPKYAFRNNQTTIINNYKSQLKYLLEFIQNKQITSNYEVIVIDNRIGKGSFYNTTIIDAFKTLKENLTTNYPAINNDINIQDIFKKIECTIEQNTINIEKSKKEQIKENVEYEINKVQSCKDIEKELDIYKPRISLQQQKSSNKIKKTKRIIKKCKTHKIKCNSNQCDKLILKRSQTKNSNSLTPHT